MSITLRSIECPAFSQIQPKKNTKSYVWEYFGLPANEDGQVVSNDIAVCKLCKTPVSSRGGSTSNILGHIKLHHPIKYNDISNKRQRQSNVIVDEPEPNYEKPNACSVQQVITEDETQVQNFKSQRTMMDFQPLDAQSAKRCTDIITKFLTTTMQPYNIVDQKSFIDMVQVLNPKYKLPGRKHFSNTAIPKLYTEVKEKIKCELSLVKDNAVSISTDCWTSTGNTPYIAVTVHFISPEWDLKSACLACTHFEEDHNAENISSFLKNVLSEWGLNIENVASCTTDNGANILKAVQELNLSNVHVSCFGHNINIGVNHALQLTPVEKAVARLKKLQNTIAMSWKFKRNFVKAQELLKMDVKTLLSACPTQWWSTLKLISRFLDNQLAVCKMLLDCPKKKYLMLEGTEVSALQDFVSATELLEDITKTLSEENYMTAASVLPLYQKIKINLKSNDSDSKLLADIKLVILDSFKKYENEPLKSLLSMSTLCDPRFHNFIDEESKRTALRKMADVYKEKKNTALSINPTELPPKKVKKGLAKFFEVQEIDHDNLASPSQQAEEELRNYLAMPKINFEENPLNWWRIHQESFPTLKILAKIHLAIQGSSVPLERVFSTGGNVINKHRTSLLTKHAEMQVFLAHNKHYY